MNTNVITIKVTDVDYYYMIENQIRKYMPMFEIGHLLPLAETILRQSNISKQELKEYPIEGYYYKSDALRLYFTILRNLQMNQDFFGRVKQSTVEFLEFQEKTDNPLFGQKRPYPVPGYEFAPLKRRYDLVTLALEDSTSFNVNSERPWTIEGIMQACAKHCSGQPNLVEFAWMTKDPRCVCAGAETNAAYRMYGLISGCSFVETYYEWAVNPALQTFGEKVAYAYQELYGCPIVLPNVFNHTSLNKRPEIPRVALLGKVLATGENYYWIIDAHETFSDRYDRAMLTTEMFLADKVKEHLVFNPK